MRNGIYLGPRSGPARSLTRALVLLGVVGTLLHAAMYVLDTRALEVLRADVERRERAAATEPPRLDDDASAVLSRLGAAAESGVAAKMAPTELLQIIAAALPDEVALVGVSLEPSVPRASLLIDAIARREEDVTALETSMAAADRVAATKLLGERTAADGSLSVRLQVDLEP